MVRMLADSPELLEKLNSVEIIYTDLDGTLFVRGGTLLSDATGAPSLEAAEAVVALNKAGIPVIPVTGRSRAQCTEIVRILGWNDFIAEAGSIRSYWNGTERENIYDVPEWRFELGAKTPIEYIRESGALDALMEAFPGRIEQHDPWHLGRETTDVLRGSLNRQLALEVLDRIPLALSLIDNGVIHPPKHSLEFGDDPIRAYHLGPAGISKRRAIALDLERRNIDPENALMIGDGPSDMLVAEVLGVSLLVKNALKSPGIEKRIDAIENCAVVDRCMNEGWADIAHEILRRRG